MLIPFPFFFAFLLLFYHVFRRMFPYHLSDGQWIHLFANAKAEGKMDDQEAWLEVARNIWIIVRLKKMRKIIGGCAIFFLFFFSGYYRLILDFFDSNL